MHLQSLLDEQRVILKEKDIKTATDIRGVLVLDRVSVLPRRMILDCSLINLKRFYNILSIFQYIFIEL